MAAGTVSAFEVGSFFINQYYRLLKESPDYSHQFYNDSSTITRVDGDETHTASNIVDIHSLLNSLNVTGVEVTKLNCQDSWSRGILLIVSGFMKSKNFNGKRMFTQAFLAPQEKGYFVFNDILQFNDEVLVNKHTLPEMPEVKVDSEVQASTSHLDQPVSTYELEEETREYVNPVHVEEDSPVDKYSLPDEEQHEEPQQETVVEEAPVEESHHELAANHVSHVEDLIPVPSDEPAEEPAREPAKLSYASILRASKGQSSQPVASQSTERQSMPPPQEQHQRVQTNTPQLNPSVSSNVPDAAGAGADEGLVQEEGELTSVYVRSLPSNVTNTDLEEFKKFGRIRPNGIFIRNRKEIGVGFAFVEFEDISGVHNATKASPIELLGRQVFIEERRANTNSSSRGGVAPRGRGRGRENYQNETTRGRGGSRNPSRGSVLDVTDYNRSRVNGYQQRGSQ